MTELYGEDFIARRGSMPLNSANVLVPIVMRLVDPRSVVDIGCGRGEWLSIFRESGLNDYLGIDGPWVSKKDLAIDPTNFVQCDLELPLDLDRKFDLAVSLEVAEHLSQENASVFVNSLCDLSPVVLFSAAVPRQGGTNHLNEQWPDYWAKLFASHGFKVFDCIRWQVWNDNRVGWWYAQNTFLYVEENHIDTIPELAKYLQCGFFQMSAIHPLLYMKKAAGHDKYKSTLKHRLVVVGARWLRNLPAPLRIRLRSLESWINLQRKFVLTDVSWPENDNT